MNVSQESALKSNRCRFRPTARAELAHDTCDVPLDSALSDAEFVAYLLGRASSSHGLDHLKLTTRQTFQLRSPVGRRSANLRPSSVVDCLSARTECLASPSWESPSRVNVRSHALMRLAAASGRSAMQKQPPVRSDSIAFDLGRADPQIRVANVIRQNG
jgi:hypothetical protein